MNVKVLAEEMEKNINNVIKGKEDIVHLAVAAFLAGGNILLEEVPGSGKTVFAKTMAATIGGIFKRIQMTPDLLPADITGINFFNMKKSEFEFVEGPVFSNILLADEINRATPKTQAGLLECMEEKQVTIEGKTYELKKPFMVIATENPVDNQGVFPLPEAQTDRFLMKLSMSYPDHKSMLDIMKTHMNGFDMEKIKPVVDIDSFIDAIDTVKKVSVHDDIIEYIVNITEMSRKHPKVYLGISQRGALGIIKASKAIAAMDGRDYVKPDDVKMVYPAVCRHRIILKNSERLIKDNMEDVLTEIINSVNVPAEMI